MILTTNLVKEDGKFNSVLPSLVTITTNDYIYVFPKCCIKSLFCLDADVSKSCTVGFVLSN